MITARKSTAIKVKRMLRYKNKATTKGTKMAEKKQQKNLQ